MFIICSEMFSLLKEGRDVECHPAPTILCSKPPAGGLAFGVTNKRWPEDTSVIFRQVTEQRVCPEHSLRSKRGIGLSPAKHYTILLCNRNHTKGVYSDNQISQPQPVTPWLHMAVSIKLKLGQLPQVHTKIIKEQTNTSKTKCFFVVVSRALHRCKTQHEGNSQVRAHNRTTRYQ